MADNIYTIKRGDTLGALAKANGTTIEELAKYNSIADPNKIYAGATLKIPGAVTAPPVTPPAGGGATPPPTPAPAPTPAPVDTTRYARTANPNDQAITDLEKTLSGAYPTEAPNKDTILEEKRKNAQALVDSIQAEFAKIISDQTGENSKMNDRVRALNTSSGLGGSDFATSNAIGQETKNKKALDLIEKEKAAKIQAVYADIDQRASEEYRKQREDYIAGLKDNLAAKKAARDEDRNKALNSIKGFASAGVDVTKLKQTDPETFNTLLSEYGGSELDLETAWNAALPDNKKVQYGQLTKRGANGNAVIVRYGLNPVTGTTEQHEYDMGIPYGDFVGKGEPELKEIDGRLWSISKDENGNQVAKPLTEVSDLVKSQINENNASAAKSRADANGTSSSAGFKFSGTQRTKLIGAGGGWNDAKINAIESDLKTYGLDKVMEGLSTQAEKDQLANSLKGSDLAEQLAEYLKK